MGSQKLTEEEKLAYRAMADAARQLREAQKKAELAKSKGEGGYVQPLVESKKLSSKEELND